MAEYSTGRSASHENPLLFISFVSLITAAALIMALGECFFGAQGHANGSKAPLMSRPRKQAKKWWQFWRKQPVSDVEQNPDAPNQHTISYGTIGVFADFSRNFTPAADALPENSWAPPQVGRWVSDAIRNVSQNTYSWADSTIRQGLPPNQWTRRTSYVWAPSERPTIFGGSATSNASILTYTPPKRPDSFADQYELVQHLVFSSEGHVFHVKHRETGEQRIIKQIWSGEKTADGAWHYPNEPDMLQNALKAQHANIVQLVDVKVDFEGEEPFYNLITEFCNAGDCFKLTRSNQQLPQQLILAFIANMIDALSFLHFGETSYDSEIDQVTSISHRQEEILHCDIKPENVFMSWSPDSPFGLPTFQLGDFGHACTNTTNRGIGGTRGYRAPELQNVVDQADIHHPLADPFIVDNIQRLWRQHTKASDIWSLAASIYALMARRVYVPGKSNVEGAFAKSTLADCPEILAMLKACLSEKPADRPQINKYHRLSARIKQDLKQWYDNGGRLDSAIWTAQLPAPSSSAQTEYLEQPNGPPSSVYSRTPSYEPMHPLRRMNANNNLRPSWNTMMRGAGFELPVRVEQVPAAQPTSWFSSDSSVGSNRRPSWL